MFSMGLFEVLSSNVQILPSLSFSILQCSFEIFQSPEIEIREFNIVEEEKLKMIIHKKLVEKINMLNKKNMYMEFITENLMELFFHEPTLDVASI